jgi:hypothetical protein
MPTPTPRPAREPIVLLGPTIVVAPFGFGIIELLLDVAAVPVDAVDELRNDDDDPPVPVGWWKR